jgi:hypothetical protein
MSEELIQQITKVAELKGSPELEDPKTGNTLLNEALEEFYPNDTVRLKHLRKALNTTAKVGWDVLIQAKPAQMVDICVAFLAGDEEQPTTKKKKAPAKKAAAPKAKAPKKKAPPPEDPPEEEETPEEEEAPPPEKAPTKRRPVRRGKTKPAEPPTEEPTEEAPKEPKAASKKKKAPAKEVVADLAAIEKYIDEKFDGLDKALLDIVSPADLQAHLEEVKAEHARTRSMLQQFYHAVYKMIADEDYVPPAELDED